MKERNFGIDFLRILSMIMVLILHILNQGGILRNVEPFSLNYVIAWILEIVCFSAVNIYGIISGYVGIDSKHKIENILKLWLIVLFYSVLITIIYQTYQQTVNIKDIIKSLFPVINYYYWYFTSYFCLFFLMPYINTFIKRTSKDKLKKLLITIFILFSILEALTPNDLFFTNFGYSPLWLLILYIIGAYIKINNNKYKKKYKYLIIFLIFITFIMQLFIDFYKYNNINSYENLLLTYTSPTILISSIIIFLKFKSIKFKNALIKIISFTSPLVFSVYLIHTHPIIWNNILKNKFIYFIEYPFFKFIISIVTSVLIIFFLCLIIDYIRTIIFKIIKIDKIIYILNTIINKFKSYIKKFVDKVI